MTRRHDAAGSRPGGKARWQDAHSWVYAGSGGTRLARLSSAQAAWATSVATKAHANVRRRFANNSALMA